MKKLFGTDGIRGVAGEAPLDEATVAAIGHALGEDLGRGARVVMGADTRQSSSWIAELLAAALVERGVEVAFAGVIPTPGVAYLAAAGACAAGVMISASHNPYQDNGIKVFGGNGYKLPDAEEARIEAAIDANLAAGRPLPRPRPLPVDKPLRAAYVAHLGGQFAGTDFSRLHVIVDCAHGAASLLAGELFARLGLRAALIACEPSGTNINAGVGALHPKSLAAAVTAAGADAGLALDGDADRAILVAADGSEVDGDSVLYMAARRWQAEGKLTPAVVVGTQMSNYGLELALAELGIGLERTAVGDKYVLERMRQLKAPLGGEPSGHVVFGPEATTGDGLLTGLHAFDLMAREGRSLSALAAGWKRFPQQITNVIVREKRPLEQMGAVQAAIRAAETHFGDQGRVLVRYSGTEKKARVMVEGRAPAEVEHHAKAIAQALRQSVGV